MSLETAAKTLVYYVKLAHERTGHKLDGDCLVELDDVIAVCRDADAELRALRNRQGGASP